MKGVILAGGTGSRLYPLTKCINKHLLPVGNKPMVYYAIEKLTESGINNICIVTGIEHAGTIIQALGSGKDFNCSLTYRIQDNAGGIAQALYLTKDFVNNDKICVILGDNVFTNPLIEYVKYFNDVNTNGAMILIKEVSNPSRYGVVTFGENNTILGIEEKPKEPKSNYAVTGIYFYDNKVWNIIETLKPSGRNELEITDVNNQYIQNGILHFGVLQGFWSDCGTFESLHRTNMVIHGLSI